MRFPPFDTYGMDDKDVLLLKETCGALATNYKTEFLNIRQRKDVGANFKDLQEDIAGVAIIENQLKKCILIFIKVGFQTSTKYWANPNLSNSSYQVLAFTHMRRNFGTVSIRKKRTIDMLLDVFTSVALRFKNNKAFDNNFHVLAEDKEKTAAAINEETISLLMNIRSEEFLINITNKKLIVECPYTIDPQRTVKLAEFTSCMSVV